MTTLSLNQARRLALSAGSGFHRPPGRGRSAVASLVDRIGFIQIDTISVVERAHHHILATRLPGYQKEWLGDQAGFEYWAHAAAWLPWRDYPHTLIRKARIREGGHDWYRVEADEVDRVLDRIRAEGPLMARDFEAPRQTEGWWDWKPAKRALEYLFMAGLLMVRREGFQKIFDLTERVLPPGTETQMPSPHDHAAWMVDRALDAWGLAARDEFGYQRREHQDLIDPVLAEEVEAGELVPVAVEGLDQTTYWLRASDLERIDQLPGPDRALRILSPFDPFVIHRRRIKRLFDFDFSIECYIPEARRTFGYFALPLLWGGRFVGLLDTKADRDAGRLVVKKLRYDGPAKRRAAFDQALEKSLAAFSAFNGVEAPFPPGQS